MTNNTHPFIICFKNNPWKNLVNLLMPAYKLDIPDIVCPACIVPVENALKSCLGVLSVKVDVVEKTAWVTTSDEINPSVQVLYNALEDIGYPATPTKPAISITPETTTEITVNPVTQQKISKKSNTRRRWIKGLVGIVSGATMMALCMFTGGLPVIAMWALGGVSALLTLYLGKDTYKKAVMQLIKARTLSMESLFTVSTLLAVGVSVASFFVPWLPHLFDTGLFILGFKEIGDAVKESVKQQVADQSLRSDVSKQVELAETNEMVYVKDLKPGQIIRVRRGQMVPVDAKSLKTASIVPCLTGEAIPETIGENVDIPAGSKVPNNVDFIDMRVEKTEENSTLARMDESIKKSQDEKSSLETSTNIIVNYFVRGVFVVAIVSALVMGFLVSPIAAIQAGISILSAACPCTLGLIIPLAYRVAEKKAMARGIQFKDGKKIDAAGDIDTIAIDLNGTFTTGELEVVDDTMPEKMWDYLWAIEKDVDHPFAKALTNHAASKKKNDLECKSIAVSSLPSGVKADIDGETCYVGDAAMMKNLSIDISDQQEVKLDTAQHVIYFVRGKKVVGSLALRAPLRPGAKEVIKKLREMGKKIVLVTGSTLETAQIYAPELGLREDEIKAGCGARKKEIIESLMKEGKKVAMIGDGLNDSTAMAACHFGIAINWADAHQVTQNNAGAVIGGDNLWSIIDTFVIAEQAKKNIRQNLSATIFYNVSVMLIFALLPVIGFAINPALGAVLMFAQMGLVMANLERFRRQKVPAADFVLPTTAISQKSTHANVTRQLAKLTPAPSPALQNTVAPTPAKIKDRYSVIDPPGSSMFKTLKQVCVGDLVRNFQVNPGASKRF